MTTSISNDLVRPQTDLVVNRTSMEWTRELPNRDRENLFFFADWLNRNLKTRNEMGEVLRQANGSYYGADSMRKLFSGQRMAEGGQSLKLMLEAVASFVELERQRQGQTTHTHVDTRTNRRISQVCRKALTRGGFGFIVGGARIGKTWGLKNYMVKEERARVIYVEVTGASLGSFFSELCHAFGFQKSASYLELEAELISRFDANTVLLIDEAQNAFPTTTTRSAPPIFRFLKTLWNKKKCPIIISVTDEGADQMKSGKQRKFFEQILGRRAGMALLPRKMPDDDLDRFSAQYGLPAAPNKRVKVETISENAMGESVKHTLAMNPYTLQTEVNSTQGLAVWITILQDACDLAKESGKKVTWGAVIRAYSATLAEEQLFQ